MAASSRPAVTATFARVSRIALSAAASVEASDRIASSMISPNTTRRSAQSAPSAASASIAARTITWPSQSRVLKLGGLMRRPAPPAARSPPGAPAQPEGTFRLASGDLQAGRRTLLPEGPNLQPAVELD